MKEKARFVCTQCGATEPRWLGRCPGCGSWNTLEAQTQPAGKTASARSAAQSQGPQLLHQVESNTGDRRSTGLAEFDRVLGGGAMMGSTILIGGEPGIGKSTLLLQCAAAMQTQSSVLYVSGEESPEQIRNRASRLSLATSRLYVQGEHDVLHVLDACRSLKPAVVIIDSIQTLMHPDAGAIRGTVNQIRYCSAELGDWARQSGAVVFFVAHVTKEGLIAGPKVMEHLVDTVLYFEHSGGDVRFVRASKNRFGSTDEVGVFSMSEQGLAEVGDPSSLFLVHRDGPLPAGTVVAPVYEGSRVFMVELQALTVPAKGGMSRVFSERVDPGRVSRIAAVLEKHAQLRFSDQDLYVNVAGGIRLAETGIDLPLALALFSARTGLLLPPDCTVTGELSLAGEVRPVAHFERRMRTAADMGFKTIIGPAARQGDDATQATWRQAQNILQALGNLSSEVG